MLTVTMSEIARRAGVDQSTVSLALRNSARISMAMRRKIQKLAEEMGYRPNPLVSALMRNRRKRYKPGGSSVMAWVSSWPTRDGWLSGGPIYKAFFDGAAGRLGEHGFKLEDFWFDKKSITPARFSDILLARGITGLIVAPTPSDDPELQLDWDRFSATTIGRSLRNPALDRVDAAHFEGITTAIRQCKRLGYKVMGLAIEQVLIERFERRWLAGYLVNAAENGRETCEVFTDSIHDPAAVEKFRAWFAKYNPDLILTVSRRDGLRLVELLNKHLGKSVPGDVGVVILSCQARNDELSGIFQFPMLLGAQAGELLVRKTMLNETGIPDHPMTFSLNGMWNPGKTVRAGEEAEPAPAEAVRVLA